MRPVPAPEFALSVFGTPRFVAGPDREPTLTQQRILERMALNAGSAVQLEQLIDAAWDADPPRHARAAIQNQISRIRAVWGEHVIETTATGYVLGVTTDASRLHELSSRAEILLEEGDFHQAFELAEAILPLWAGRPFTAIEHVESVFAIRRALSASCKGAENTRLAAGLALGRSAWAVHEGERLVAESPHDEYRHAMLARALALAGRRGDALASIAAARRQLRGDLGIDAGPLLLAAEEEILHPITPALAPHSLTFVGRDAELRIALASLARGKIVRVHGDPGSGVTRLLREAHTHLRALGVRVAFVDARDHTDSAVGVLRAIAAEAPFDSDESRGLVADFPRAAARFAEHTALAIVVDNADAIGPSSSAAIASAASARVLVLLGTHAIGAPEDDDPRLITVPLEGLDRAAVIRLAASGPDGPLAPDEIDRLLAYSGGNPLAIETLLATQPHAPDTVFQAPSADAAVRLRALTTAFLHDLSPRDRDLIERAAVAGEGYPVAALPDGDHPAELPRGLVTVTDGAIQFRHGAVRDAVYLDIPPGRREELHAELGRAARSAGAAAVLIARHLLAAGALATVEAADACRTAAHEASRQGAHADAAQWLSHVADAPALTGIERLSARVELGDQQRLAGDPRHLQTLTDAAHAALATGDEQLIAAACFALLQLGATSASGAPPEGVPEVITRALAVLTTASARARVSGAASLAWSLTGDAQRSQALFLDAERLADDAATRADVLPFAYMALGMPEQLDHRRAITQELGEIATQRGDRRALFEAAQLAFSVHLQDGDGDGARGAVRTMAELIEDVGDVGRRWALQYARAAVAHLDGDDDECERYASEASALFTSVSPSRTAAAYGGQLLALRMTQNRVSELAPLFSELVQTQPGVPAWHAAFALATEDDAETITHATLAWERAQPDLTWLAAHVVAGRAVARVGDAALIDRYLARLQPWSGRGVWQGTCSYGPVDTALALLHRARGNEDAAHHHTRLAAQLAQGLGAPFVAELATAELEQLAV